MLQVQETQLALLARREFDHLRYGWWWCHRHLRMVAAGVAVLRHRCWGRRGGGG